MELLSKLYQIHSKSGNERMMTEFVAKCCANLGAKVNIDEHGNVYAAKGESDTYPCVVAHLDQVQTQHAHDFTLKMQGDVIYAFSESFRGQQGLGADDKNGIWCAIKALARFDVLKVAFFVGEEIGCVGSSKADIDVFTDCRFVLQCDRRGSSDLIINASGTELCSEAFVKDVLAVDFGYKTTSGMMTDVMELKQRGLAVSCCNISCGYYNAHTDSEVTVVSELVNCFKLVCSIIERCTDVYPHEYVAPKWESKSCYGRSLLGDDYYGSYYGYYGTSLSDKKKADDTGIENDMMCDMWDILQMDPEITFADYWKDNGQFWGVKKRRAKKLFNELREELKEYALV